MHMDTHNWTTEGKQPSEKWVKSELAPKDGQLTREHLERPSTSQATRDCMLKGSWGTTAQLEWLELRTQHTMSWTWHRAKGVFVHSWAGLQKAQPPADDLTHLHGDEAGLHVGWSQGSEAKTRVHTETSQGLVSVECTDASPPVLIFCLQNLYCMEHTPLIQCLLYGTHSFDTTCIVRNTLLWLNVYCTQHTPPTECLVYGTHSSDRVSIVWKTFL